MAQTGRELLSKLQFAHPQAYPDGLLRTVQRRLKVWRAAIARKLVFGANHGARLQYAQRRCVRQKGIVDFAVFVQFLDG